MTVTAKFRCVSLNYLDPGVGSKEVIAQLKLSAVYGDGKENKDWSKWTPAGEITMTVTNPAAVDYFRPGKEFFVVFQEAAPPELEGVRGTP